MMFDAGPLIPEVQVDPKSQERAEQRRQFFNELRQTEYHGVYSDIEWDQATNAVEKILCIQPHVIGTIDSMGEASYAQYWHNCRNVVRAVFESRDERRIPREPNKQMVRVGIEKFNTFDSRKDNAEDVVCRMWRFMYDVAIETPEQSESPR